MEFQRPLYDSDGEVFGGSVSTRAETANSRSTACGGDDVAASGGLKLLFVVRHCGCSVLFLQLGRLVPIVD